ncbi:MAG: hypothetical protein ACFFBD_00870 [Candidatus Hodarchaeota archaeon]
MADRSVYITGTTFNGNYFNTEALIVPSIEPADFEITCEDKKNFLDRINR